MWRIGKRGRPTDDSAKSEARHRAGDRPDDAGADADGGPQAVDAGEPAGFGELRLDLPGPFTAGWRQSLRARLALATLSRRAPQLGAVPVPLLAAGWAAAVGALIAALLLLVSGVPFTGQGVAVIWLAANRVPIGTQAGIVTLLPLGLLATTLLPARRAGRFVVVQLGADRARNAVLAAVGCYGVLAAAATLVPGNDAVRVAWPAALGWSALVAGAGMAWGVARERNGAWRPPPLAIAVGATVVIPVLIATTLAFGLVLANLGPIVAAQQQLASAPLDHVGLVLLQLAYLPNLLIWAGAFVVGSGFSTGGGNTLSPFTDGMPMLPDLPVLAAMPSDVPTWTALLPLTVAATGALAATLLARGAHEPRLGPRAARVGVIAMSSGILWALLALVSAGGIGDQRLAAVGPSLATGVVAAVLVAGGGLVWAVVPSLASDARPRTVDLRSRVRSRGRNEAEPAGRR